MSDEVPRIVEDTFHDDFISKHADPLARTHYEPDWALIYHHLDGDPPHPDSSWEQKLELAARLVAWLSAALQVKNRRARVRVLGLRALALIYYVWPAMLPCTRLEDLARHVQISRKHLSLYTAEACRLLRLPNSKSHPRKKPRRP